MNREYRKENLQKAKDEGKDFFHIEIDSRHLSNEQNGKECTGITLTGLYTREQRRALLLAERCITKGKLTAAELEAIWTR